MDESRKYLLYQIIACVVLVGLSISIYLSINEDLTRNVIGKTTNPHWEIKCPPPPYYIEGKEIDLPIFCDFINK